MRENLLVSGLGVSLSARDSNFISAWLEGRSKHTLRAYSREVEEFRRRFPGLLLEDVKSVHIETHLEALNRLSPSSKRRARAVLGSLFSFGVRNGFLRFNPVPVVEKIVVPEPTIRRFLLEEEISRMLKAATKERDRLIIKLLFVSGMRVSELCGLSWGDMEVQAEGGAKLRIAGKVSSEDRYVQLSRGITELLFRLKEKKLKADCPIFRSQKGGGRLDPSQILRVVKKVAVEAGMSGKESPHWLRNSHAVEALSKGCPVPVLQNSLGHRAIASTFRYVSAVEGETSAAFFTDE